MSQIKIQHPHRTSVDVIKSEVKTLADRLRQRYGARCQWVDDCHAKVSATGVEGMIQFDASSIDIQVKLGFMVSMMKSRIEADIRDYLNRHVPRDQHAHQE